MSGRGSKSARRADGSRRRSRGSSFAEGPAQAEAGGIRHLVIRVGRAPNILWIAAILGLVALLLVGGFAVADRLGSQPRVPAALRDLPQVHATVGDRQILLVIAVDHARGLTDIDDLGDVDGMLFAYDTPADPSHEGFWMQGVRIPLDAAFFDADRRLIAQVAMRLCSAADEVTRTCPVYASPAPFKWVLETPAGSLRLQPGARLELTGG